MTVVVRSGSPVTVRVGNPAAESVVAGYIGTGGALDTGLDARYAQGGALRSDARTQGNVVMFLGDSHTAGSGASNVVFSYSAVAARIAGTEAVTVSRQGFAGERSDELLARLPGLLTSVNPGGVFVMCGTNDAGQSVTVATFLANIEAMKALTDAANVPLYVGLVPPVASGVTSAAARMALVKQYNMALYRRAIDLGLNLTDTFTPIVDDATGYMSATYDSGDGIHLNDAGHALVAAAVAPNVAAGARLAPWPVTTKGLGLLANPLNDSGLGGWVAIAGTPDGTSGYEAPTPGDGVTAGDWFHLDKDNSGSGTNYAVIRAQSIDMTDVDEGDVLLCLARYKMSGDTTVTLRVLRGSTSVSLPVDSADQTPLSGHLSQYTVQAADIGQTMRWGFSVNFLAGGSGSGAVAQVDVYNLTKAGLTSVY